MVFKVYSNLSHSKQGKGMSNPNLDVQRKEGLWRLELQKGSCQITAPCLELDISSLCIKPQPDTAGLFLQ